MNFTPTSTLVAEAHLCGGAGFYSSQIKATDDCPIEAKKKMYSTGVDSSATPRFE